MFDHLRAKEERNGVQRRTKENKGKLSVEP